MSKLNMEQLDTGYGEHLIIQGLNLEVPSGKVTSIIGPNGCGKSTLLKTIGRILKPNKGMVQLSGYDIHKMPTRELAKKLAILPQSPIAPEGLSVGELVSYGRFPHHSKSKLSLKDLEIVDWSLEITGLSDLKKCAVDTLSGGQRQRVWIAMAICQQAEVILLDEPTTYLDMAFQLEVLLLLKGLNEKYGTTIVMVMHDLNLAARVSDFMVAMRSGEIVQSGLPREVMTSETLRKVYDIDAYIIEDPVTRTKICQSYTLIKKPCEKSISMCV